MIIVMNAVSKRTGDASDIVYSYPFQSQTGHRLQGARIHFISFSLSPQISYIVVIISANTPPYLVIIFYYYVSILFHVTCPNEIQHNLKIFHAFSSFFFDLLTLFINFSKLVL